mmetsp:Transcript_35419/g.57302  ORF Transcript_35419/g.57302 Transcript_35419/m.57302 type:complete len:742 (-) Transcript_35419:255-2480(-)
MGSDVREVINSNFKNLNDLSKCSSLLQDAYARKEVLEAQKREMLAAQELREENVRQTLTNAASSLQDLKRQWQEFSSSSKEQMNLATGIANDLGQYLARVEGLRRTKKYLELVQRWRELSASLDSLPKTSAGSVLVCLQKLNKLHEDVDKFLKETSSRHALKQGHSVAVRSKMPGAVRIPKEERKEQSDGNSLGHELLAVVTSAETSLRSQSILDFKRALRQALTDLHWPAPRHTVFVGSEQKAQFERAFQSMLALYASADLIEAGKADESNVTGTNIPAIQVLLEGLEERFRYHFEGSRQTNRLDKPEWYMTNVLTTLREHSHFLESAVQPALDNAKILHIDAKTEIARGLVTCVCNKLRTDLPALLDEHVLLAHTIDEAICFQKELQSLLMESDDVPSVLNILCENADTVNIWIQLERLSADESLASLIEKDDAWDLPDLLSFTVDEDEQQLLGLTTPGLSSPSSDPSDDHNEPELRPSKSAEELVSLLAAITERYRLVADHSVRLRFVEEVQFPLLVDYISQMKRALHRERKLGSREHWKHFSSILNSAHYLASVLHDWGDSLFFLDLSRRRTPDNNSDEDSESQVPLFKAYMDDLLGLVDEEITHLASTVVGSRFRDCIRKYFKHRQDHRPPAGQGGSSSGEVSAHVYEATVFLDDHLRITQEFLTPSLFTRLGREIANEVNHSIMMFLYERTKGVTRDWGVNFRANVQLIINALEPFVANPHRLLKEGVMACLTLP